jgi:oligopeptide transport system substrate-binding protein
LNELIVNLANSQYLLKSGRRIILSTLRFLVKFDSRYKTMMKIVRHRLFASSVILLLLLLLPINGCLLSGEQGTLNLWDSGPITLDPALSGDLSSHTYITQVFSGLLRLDDSLNPVPDIAESWQRSQDGKIYTFSIRKGVNFHNGKSVTAQDFKYSWERACYPNTKSQTAAMYLNDIVGATDVMQGKSTEITGIKVVDTYTLRVTIDAPKAYFLAKLAYPTTFVVDQANVEKQKDWWHNPNGTGPFKFKEWNIGKTIVLESNNNFYRQPPKIQQLVFHILAGTPIELYEMSEIDIAPIDENYIDRVTDKKGPFYKELATCPELSLYYIGFNTSKAPFDDINFRKALCYAVNKERIVNLTLKGIMSKTDGILPKGMPGYNTGLQGLSYDLDKAKSLLASSRYSNKGKLPPIEIIVSGYGGNIQENLGAILQDWQQNLGIEVSVRQLEPEIYSFPQHLKEENYQMFLFGWIADYPDPQDFLEILFHSKGGYNIGNYSDKEVDGLLEKAAIELDTVNRYKLYQQAEQKLVTEAACLPLWLNTNYVLIKPYVKDYKLNSLGIPSFEKVFIGK